MGKFLLTVLTSLLTYYLLVIVIVKASTISLSSSPEYSDTQKENYLENLRSALPVQVGFTINGGNPRSNYHLRNSLGVPVANSIGAIRQNLGAGGGDGTRSKLPVEMDLLVDDDDVYLYDKSKRYDDYGHMRFGKRSEEDHFDDYGHMRFGKKSKTN